MKIWRIRRCSGVKDGSNFYWHADVIASTWYAALRAAKNRRVRNWRWIDKFDKSPENYTHYQYLYRVNEQVARQPMRPIFKKDCLR